MKRLLFSAFLLFATALAVGCTPRQDVSEQTSAVTGVSSSSEMAEDAPAAAPVREDPSPGVAVDRSLEGPTLGDPQSVLLAVEKPTDADPINAGAELFPRAVAAGDVVEFQVAVSIAPGWHIYGEQTTPGPYPPTRLTLDLPEGFVEEEGSESDAHLVPTPQGASYHHRDRAILIRKVRVPASAEPGSHSIQATLEYQACNAARCLPPERLPLSASFDVTQGRAEAFAP